MGGKEGHGRRSRRSALRIPIGWHSTCRRGGAVGGAGPGRSAPGSPRAAALPKRSSRVPAAPMIATRRPWSWLCAGANPAARAIRPLSALSQVGLPACRRRARRGGVCGPNATAVAGENFSRTRHKPQQSRRLFRTGSPVNVLSQEPLAKLCRLGARISSGRYNPQ